LAFRVSNKRESIVFAILGAGGKVGSSTIRTLRAANKPVRAIVREPSKARRFEALGCEVAIVDMLDVSALSKALEGASAVQVICPTAPQASDAAAQMRGMIDSVTAALRNVPPQTTLAISDYGAEVESGTGITVLFHARGETECGADQADFFAIGRAHGELGARHACRGQ
jgi:NAD(P)H dehydrogenase (quinone)